MKRPSKPEPVSEARPLAPCVVVEEITKATQTAQLLSSDLGSAYKAAEDPLMQTVLTRLMKTTNKVRSDLTRIHTAMEKRC